MDLPKPLVALIRDLELEMGARLSDVSERVTFPSDRLDVRAFTLFPSDNTVDSIKTAMRCRLSKINWQISEMDDRPLLLFVAPMVFVSVRTAYHATRSANLDSVFQHGLLPSVPELSNTGRADCIGNIDVCPTLGNDPVDLDAEPEKGTAPWWRWHLSHKNSFNDPDWCILRVELANVEATVYRDIWSNSGLIVDGIDRVPTERLTVIWPT